MPEILKKEFPGGWLALWHIEERAEELILLVTRQEAEASEGLTSDKRRREWLAWRALLRRYIPDARVEYDSTGAPRIENGWIGVSHTDDYTAVIFSHEKPCAVDMECTDRDFTKAAPRFISAEEAVLPGSSDPLFPAVVWCGKEVLYKLAGRKELDLREDIHITDTDIAGGTATGYFADSMPYRMQFMVFEGMIVVYYI